MNIQNKMIGSLKWVAIGDALGLPVEIHTRSQIIRLLNQEFLGDHNGLIDRYYPIGRHGMYRKSIPSSSFPGLTCNSTGICSDDTILTLALADSIREQGWIDMDDMVERHVQAVQDEPFGFWKWTRSSMERIANGADWRSVQDVSFWNGMMMKQSPLAFYEAMSREDIESTVLELARITHAHPISLVAAQVHHRFLVDVIISASKNFDMMYWLNDGIEYAKQCENDVWASSQLSTLFQDIKKEWTQPMSLETIWEKYARKIDSEKNPYFNILSTIGIVYAIFLRKQDFAAVQQWASIGGDTDSYASILGSMSGALQWDIFPEQYIKDLHPRYRQKLEKTIHSLA